MVPDIEQHSCLPFPKSLPEFQRLFPNDAACATYLEKIHHACAQSARAESGCAERAVYLGARCAILPAHVLEDSMLIRLTPKETTK